ncbi:MAG: HgcAB-like fusion protein [Candidatus Aminicenantes bacterium]
MSRVKYLLINVVETLLRFFPVPCRMGLIEIGNPDQSSPVFLTCNYHLTVQRVKRELKGINCYLLVCNSGGINVWCGSAGGHLDNHSVISVLKTSGIENRINHRKVIAPQLAASGVDQRVISQKTGWKMIWGPVYAKQIPDFMKNKGKKTTEMRVVRFPLLQRIEAAVMWAFPLSAAAGLLTAIFWPPMILSSILFIWGISFMVFLLFPLYSKWVLGREKTQNSRPKNWVYEVLRVFLCLWGTFWVGLLAYSGATHSFNTGFWFKWGILSLAVVFLLSIDLAGSTPIYKSGMHEDRLFTVYLDKGKCRGAGFCEKVCPRNCFEIYEKTHSAEIPRASLCIQCGACIVQCPFDALFFKNPQGEVVTPEMVRKFKLNLMGKRALKMD